MAAMQNQPMQAPDPTAAAINVTSLDNASESPTTALYRAVIGPINNDYYLPIFQRFETHDRVSPHWNWAASLYTLNWMVYRNLWRTAFAYAAILLGTVLLVFGLGDMLFQFSETVQVSLWATLGLLSMVIPGFFGNAILHTACRNNMARALTESRTMKEALALLNQQASSRRRFIGLVLVNLLLTSGVAGAYLLLQQAPHAQNTAQNTNGVRNVVAGNTLDASIKPAPPQLQVSAPVAALPPMPTVSAPIPEPEAVKVNTTIPDASPDPIPETLPAPAKATPKVLKKKYYINVGLFAQELNAATAHTKLLNAGLNASTEELTTAKGTRTRVRAGPFKTRSEAEAAVQKIRLLKLDAIVVQL